LLRQGRLGSCRTAAPACLVVRGVVWPRGLRHGTFQHPFAEPVLPDLFTRLQGALADRYRLAGILGPERFLREIATTANLHHPHILNLYDSGQAPDSDGTLLYYVMPFVEGETLRDRIAREKQLPVDQALQITREVADALSYAHGRQVVHRDIKPENILLESGHALVADFGIARALSSAVETDALTGTGFAVGTPAYMSPEQATADRALDERSDIYSLGCVLFEMLAGQPPFTGATPGVVARQLVTAIAPPVTQFRPAVSSGVTAAVARALAKDPADRFSSTREFAKALQAEPGDSGTVAPGRRRATRRGLTVFMLGALLLTGWLLVRSRGGRPGGSSLEPPRSIAVLPFRNLRGDTADDYFTDGVTEEILHALTQIPDLRVAARTSAFQFKGKTPDVREVGDRLGVAAVLEGSIQREGDAIRITTQLTDTRTGFQIWSGKFDRRLSDLFAIEDEISRALADTLKVSLGLASRPPGAPPSVQSHELYLRQWPISRARWRATPPSRRRGRDWRPPTSCCQPTTCPPIRKHCPSRSAPPGAQSRSTEPWVRRTPCWGACIGIGSNGPRPIEPTSRR
jgi:TolB-like protein